MDDYHEYGHVDPVGDQYHHRSGVYGSPSAYAIDLSDVDDYGIEPLSAPARSFRTPEPDSPSPITTTDDTMKREPNSIPSQLRSSYGPSTAVVVRRESKATRKGGSAPKHPMSAYLFFVKEHRSKLRAAFPEKGFVAIAQFLGEQWRVLSDSARERFERRAATDKLRYHSEKQAFQESVSASDHHKSNKPSQREPQSAMPSTHRRTQSASARAVSIRRKRDPLLPRAPMTPYHFFVAAVRDKHESSEPDATNDPDLSAKSLSLQWRRLSAIERREYDAMSASDQKRFDHEMSQFEERSLTSPAASMPPKSARKRKSDEVEGNNGSPSANSPHIATTLTSSASTPVVRESKWMAKRSKLNDKRRVALTVATS